MAQPDESGEKSEAPSPKRRLDALREGNVPRSPELTAAFGLLAVGTVLAGAGGQLLAGELARLMRETFRWLAVRELTPAHIQGLFASAAEAALLGLLPVLGSVAAVSLLVGLVMGRGAVSLVPLRPKASRLSPLEGLKRVVGAQGWFNLAKGILKFALIGAALWLVLRGAWPQVTGLSLVSLADVATIVRQLAGDLLLRTGAVFLLVAGADYAWVLWRHERQLRMTKEEVKRESKDQEGDPQVKSRLRSLRQQMVRKRMLHAVRTADVVVTNPTHIAVALKYRMGRDLAPTVVAMGERLLAQRIKEIARGAGVACVENKPLARALLATAKVGRPIPLELFEAVAEVLAFVYRRKGWMPA